MTSIASRNLAIRYCVVLFLSDMPCLMHETTKQKTHIIRFDEAFVRHESGEKAPGSAIIMHAAAAGRQCLARTLVPVRTTRASCCCATRLALLHAMLT